MYYACYAPPWFFKYDILFGFIFLIVSLLISAFSYSIYKKCQLKNVREFSISFFFIGLAYLFQSIINLYIFSNIHSGICGALMLGNLGFLSYLGVSLHLLFMVIGLAILVYATLKSRESKILWVLLIVSASTLLLSKNILYSFFLLSTIYLGLISWHFIDNYFTNKNKKTLLVALAFVVLTIGWVDFILVPYSPFFYVSSHLLQLLAFALIFWNFSLVRKK